GVHAPGRGVVDHDGTGRGNARCDGLAGGTSGGEQGDVQTAEVRGGRVLDGDVLVAPRQHGPGTARRGEVAHPVERVVALLEKRTHDAADLTCCSEDSYIHEIKGIGHRECERRCSPADGSAAQRLVIWRVVSELEQG